MYDYSGLNQKLKEKGLKKSYLSEALGISSRTIAKIAKNEKIADNVLPRLCAFLPATRKSWWLKFLPILCFVRSERKRPPKYRGACIMKRRCGLLTIRIELREVVLRKTRHG